MAFPLEGIRVLDLSGPPGIWVGGFLADYGAEVIKIGRAPLSPVKFGSAGFTPLDTKEKQIRNAAYNPYDRNKKSIALNLKTWEARDIFYKLTENADVVLESYRPGVTKRLGIDYNTLEKINPRIIYCAITGYGQDGPYRDMPGHDINYISIAGVLGLTGKHDSPPAIPGTQVADWGGGGSQAVIGILLALMAREKTGEGQFVDISMTDGVISWMMGYASDYFSEGFLPEREKAVPTGSAPYNNVYETKDGKYISIGCWEPWLYENLCRALGREDFIPHQHNTGEVREQIFSAFREIFRSKTRDEWFQILKDKNICVAPVYSFDEVFNDPQVIHRNMVIELEHPTLGKVKQVGIPIKLSKTPGEVKDFAPLDGQHTDQILQEIGYSKEQIQELRKSEAIA